MPKKKTGKKSASKRGGQKGTQAKQAYVRQLVKADAAMTMSAAGKKVSKKFGTMLAFEKLREAFVAGGGKIGKRGRKRGSGAKKPGRPAETKKVRGVGRRNADARASVVNKALSSLPEHLVVTLVENRSVPNIFSSGKGAEAYIQKLLEQGVPPSEIGYYERRPMGVTVQI